MNYRTALLSTVPLAAALLPALASPAWAQTVLDKITVEADRIWPPNEIETPPIKADSAPVRDAGELLRSVPGVSAGRMGGHGVDPVIRGQKANQLNIINDGAFVHSGCPNRMDPPTATINAETMGRITVTKGYQTVTNGPGATGGTVRFDRDPPGVTLGKPYRVKAGGGYDSNGAVRDAWTEAVGGTEAGFVRGGGKWKDAENYTAGNGKKIRSAFTQFGGNIEAGWTPRDTLLSLGYEYNKVEDALFAGAGMDAPLDETGTLRFRFERRNLDAGALTGVRMNAYGTVLDHVMDNYSLRDPGTMRMIVESESDTFGGQAAADLKIGALDGVAGVDVQVNNRDARRYRRMNSSAEIVSPAYLESVTWPDVTIGQYGVFGEGTLPLAAATRLKLGARYDHVEVDYGAADVTTSQNTGQPLTANLLYAAYYGVASESKRENNLGGLVRLEHDVGASTLFAGVSRSVRTADTTERGIAHKWQSATSAGWVGNPNIDPEAHHQVDIGVTSSTKIWNAAASVFYDRVQDFILRDTARGQAGILRTDQSTIYRNVEAALAGFELSGNYRFAINWKVGADMAYTYAENLDDDRAIAQIPPLNGRISLAYAPESWMVGGRMRWAVRQTRVDSSVNTGSGQDAGETSGYAAFDLFGSYQVVDRVAIDAGVTNLFDRTYAEHLNRSSAFDTSVTQVYEPGRSFYLRARAEF